MTMTILTVPDPLLKKKSLPVPSVDEGIRHLMDTMLTTMYDASGIGLAAPQVGVLKRVIVLDVTYSREGAVKTPMAVVNPLITYRDGVYKQDEGCLSLPGVSAEIQRAARIHVTGIDRNNQPFSLNAEGMLAVCLQHEIDHLDGILFVDHLSRLKRDILLRRLKRLKKQKNRKTDSGGGRQR